MSLAASAESSASGAELFLRLTGITKRFGDLVANDRIDFEVARGEIHALLGENGAGKSTLMNIVFGLLQPDEGRIEIEGKPVNIQSPRDASRYGIGMVHQDFKLVPNMTVAENVSLSLRPERPPLLNLRVVSARIAELSRTHGLDVDPGAVVGHLPVGAQQRVEILKALYRGARLLILDEPTSVLTPQEWEALAGSLASFVSEGGAAIFISHKLEEPLAVADRCTVLRDGALVGTVRVGETDRPTLARMMVGRPVALRVPKEQVELGEPILELDNISLRENERMVLAGVDLTLCRGEILGIAGVEGNGQRELIEVVTGARQPTEGRIRIAGKLVDHGSPREFALARRGAVIPADRLATGVIESLSVAENLILKVFHRRPFSRWTLLNAGVIRAHSEMLLREYDVRPANSAISIGHLSGGNQQKCVLARELSREPLLLIADQPTRGLDVGAIEFVRQRIYAHLDRGAALLVSSDLDEVLAMSDRIAVLVGGTLRKILTPDEATTELLGLLMAGEAVPA
jgi:ABC-type uncharacterized transport system ATPase subunit